MNNHFFRVGTHCINPAHIIEINIDLMCSERQTWEKDGAECRGYRPVHYVRIITDGVNAVDGGGSDSACIDFKHGTPEAEAVIKWLEDAEVLA